MVRWDEGDGREVGDSLGKVVWFRVRSLGFILSGRRCRMK